MGLRLVAILIPALIAEFVALVDLLAPLADVLDRFPVNVVFYVGAIEALILIPAAVLGYVSGAQRSLARGRIAVAALVVLAVVQTYGLDRLHGAGSYDCPRNGTDCGLSPASLVTTLLFALAPAVVLGIPILIASRRAIAPR